MNAQLASTLLHDESDVQAMRELTKRLTHKTTVVDFEETMLLQSVRARTRLWNTNGSLVGFAFVDDFNNLRFEMETAYASDQLENEIIAWGLTCMGKRNAETGRDDTLDTSFDAKCTWQIDMLTKFGFVRQNLRSLQFSRSLDAPIANHNLPQGFSLRHVEGESEVEDLVVLHRAAFGTDYMTVEARLAIMRAPQYERELDFVVVAPEGELAAFCICGLEENNERAGYTDPIGTHPHYRQRGLGKAVVTAGMQTLKARGAEVVELGTSSENLAMRKLAETLGFKMVSEKLWFSKKVTQ